MKEQNQEQEQFLGALPNGLNFSFRLCTTEEQFNIRQVVTASITDYQGDPIIIGFAKGRRNSRPKMKVKDVSN